MSLKKYYTGKSVFLTKQEETGGFVAIFVKW